MTRQLLLGPQRPFANLGQAIQQAGIPPGRLAVVSAGWQEAEGDIDDVRELAERDLVDLRLYQRADEVFAADMALLAAYRQRQDSLMELQRLYRLRLKQLMLAARQLLRARGDTEMIAAELRHAVSQLRALDRHHCNRVIRLHADFDLSCSTADTAALTDHCAQVAETVAACDSVLITGGNVLVLINRMRLFGLQHLLQDKHVIAWSAGAMALGNRVVLFHDRTPQGRRDPELLGPGLGILPKYLFFPDASRRLRLNDRVRVDLLARRFAPSRCVTLDSGAKLEFVDRELQAVELARQLQPGGRAGRVQVA